MSELEQPILRGRRRFLAGAALAVVLAGGLAACGSSSGEVSVSPEAGPVIGMGTAVTALTVVIDDGAGKKTTWTLSCPSTGADAAVQPSGTHPTKAAACAALAAKGKQALPAVPSDRVCTQIFGGPQTAVLTGTWQGDRISASFNRSNGCEVSRWNELVGLLPRVAASAGAAAPQ